MSWRAILLSTTLVLLVAPGTAFASLSDEQNQGRALVARLQSGDKSCGDLSSENFDHIGEYVMGRVLGSTRLHHAMNGRMRLVMGEQAERRMHERMGARFAGCTGTFQRSGAGMGPGMMGGHDNDGDWSSVVRSMMGSGGWSWMMGGNWRNMTREDWHRLERQWLGTNAASAHHGTGAAAIVAITVAGALLVGVLAFVAIVRRPFRRPPAAAAN
jgi:hypothetical protein